MPAEKIFKVIFSFFITCVITVFIKSPVYAADTTPPTTTYVQTPSSPDGKNGWYKSIVRFDLSSTDLESGVKEIKYRIDQGVWQSVSFSDSLNLAPNPSFESGLSQWQTTNPDPDTTVINDSGTSAPGFESNSARIDTTGSGWHGINHSDNFAVSTSYSNMTASMYMKTENVSGGAGFKVYAISQDALGNQIVNEIAQSSTISGTQDWTQLSLEFTVNASNVIGVYLDAGLNDSGTLWIDAVQLSSSSTAATTSFSVGSDSENHIVEFYAVDVAGNQETIKTITFKLDQTPPGNWHDSGAFRGLVGPSNHHLYVYTNVEDATSGISTFTDKYQYHTDTKPGFGTFSNIMSCSSTWEPNGWTILISPPFFPGVKSAYLLTPKTDFCNSNWKACKTVRFYSEDLAGNSSTKDMCINGPWIKLRGKGVVRSNNIIDMLSEADGDNTDGLIETQGGIINFFSSSKDWKTRNSPAPINYDYDDYLDMVTGTTAITNNTLRTTSGVYLINGNFVINNQSTPNNYDDNTFNQIVFINGDLTVERDIEVANASTALFIVKGNVKISKQVETLGIAIITDGSFNTAYNVSEDEASRTLKLNGIYHADTFIFQRTLQGTNNSDTPSEDFTYEPKYLIQLKDFFTKSSVEWKSSE